MPESDGEPQSFLDRSIHWNDPIPRSGSAPLIDRIPVLGQASTVGFAVGLVLTAMTLYDWPLNLGGALFAAAGLALAGVCLFAILRRQRVVAEQDRSQVFSRDGDMAP